MCNIEKGSNAFLNSVDIEVIIKDFEKLLESASNTYKLKKETANNANKLESSFKEYTDK